MRGRKKGIAVGLTGSIASGKTTVLHLFEKLGCRVLSMDTLAHELLEYNPGVRKKILAEFGDEIANPNGKIDRGRLASIVFNDKNKRLKLESILHPDVIKTAKFEIDNLPYGSILVVEAPVLFETGWYKKVDYNVTVTCPVDIRKKRYHSNPGRTMGDFERRDQAQWSEEKKAGLSQFVIDNSGDLTKTISQVTSVLKELRP